MEILSGYLSPILATYSPPSWATAIAGVFLVVSLSLSMYLLLQHLSAYKNPEEQKFLIGVILMVPFYAIESYVSLVKPSVSAYCGILRDCYESLAMYCFGRYLVACLGGEERTIEFMKREGGSTSSAPLLPHASEKGVIKHPFPMKYFLKPWRLGEWFYLVIKFGIVQYMLIKTLCAMLSLLLEAFGAYCDRLLSHLLTSPNTCQPPLQLPLSVPDDHCSILHSLADSQRPGSPATALEFFRSSLPLMRDSKEKGKLLTAAISSLGKLGRPELARRLFDSAVSDVFGDTVFAHSALISAYARNGRSSDAIEVFRLMRRKGLKPNVVSYNAVIDACVKGNGDVKTAVGFFREMIAGKIRPDSKTFNSLLAGCSRAGQLDYAQVLFEEMMMMGIGRDIYTYNTFIDAVAKCGNMELAVRIMSEMPSSNLRPNVVTFSTLIDGYSKLERFDEALGLYDEMRMLGIKLDRVCYNTLLSIYAKKGRYEEIARVCDEMEAMGIDKDTITYNSLISGYGKQGRLDIVGFLVQDMRDRGVSPSVLTYSTLIDIYSKAGLYGDAANVFLEFKESGLKADVVLYSSFIDTLAKNGLVECAVWLLDEMVRVGIEPNVVTYNTVIDGFGKSSVSVEEDGVCIFGPIVKGFGQPMTEEARRRSEDLFCILGLFQRMVQQGVKPNVVTFSAILNACSRCNSFKDASILLEQLRLFDSFVYGVAHGLLIGSREVWMQAHSLFDELRRMDLPTSSAFYNALTDMLWHFGQKRGAQQVVLEGVQRQVWENAWSEFCLDLHLMSSGAAQAMVHAWLLSVRSIVFEGRELPEFLSILTGWGKHSKVAGASTLRRVIEALLKSIGAPFQLERFNVGRFVSPGSVIAAWLRESGTISILLLRDERAQMGSTTNLLPLLQALQL